MFITNEELTTFLGTPLSLELKGLKGLGAKMLDLGGGRPMDDAVPFCIDLEDAAAFLNEGFLATVGGLLPPF